MTVYHFEVQIFDPTKFHLFTVLTFDWSRWVQKFAEKNPTRFCRLLQLIANFFRIDCNWLRTAYNWLQLIVNGLQLIVTGLQLIANWLQSIKNLDPNILNANYLRLIAKRSQVFRCGSVQNSGSKLFGEYQPGELYLTHSKVLFSIWSWTSKFCSNFINVIKRTR